NGGCVRHCFLRQSAGLGGPGIRIGPSRTTSDGISSDRFLISIPILCVGSALSEARAISLRPRGVDVIKCMLEFVTVRRFMPNLIDLAIRVVVEVIGCVLRKG